MSKEISEKLYTIYFNMDKPKPSNTFLDGGAYSFILEYLP
jgi:hypothetical protein